MQRSNYAHYAYFAVAAYDNWVCSARPKLTMVEEIVKTFVNLNAMIKAGSEESALVYHVAECAAALANELQNKGNVADATTALMIAYERWDRA